MTRSSTPASTGTDGRLGRLLAVHATASASASRSTRNFMQCLRVDVSDNSLMPTAAYRPARPCGYPSHLRARGHRLCARPRARAGLTADGSVRPIHRSPTVMIGFCSLRRDNSSSSSVLWKLWITRVLRRSDALSTGGLAVENRWVNPVVRPQDAGTDELSTVVHRLSTGYPPVSPQACGQRRSPPVVPRTFNRLSTGRRRLWTTDCPQSSTASSPGSVHSLWITRGGHELSTVRGQRAVDNRADDSARHARSRSPGARPWRASDVDMRRPTRPDRATGCRASRCERRTLRRSA